MSTVATRGTTNGNARGSVEDRRRRRAYLMVAYASGSTPDWNLYCIYGIMGV